MKYKLLTATAIGFILASGINSPVWADEETELLRKQVKMLEARLDQLEKREQNRAASAARLEPAAGKTYPVAASGGKRLEDRVNILERKQELSEEDAKAKADKNSVAEISKKGFVITSADKQFSLKINGYAQLDNRTFFDGQTKGDDEFLARRLRPILTVQAFKDFSFRLMPDFAGASTRVFDAHADYKHTDWLQFRIGKFKPPVGLERLQSATDTFFAERGHPTNLAPSRDYGFMIYGEPLPELEYQVGIFNGNADLANSDGDDDNHKDFAARVFTQPFKNSDTLALQNLGFGVGGSYGKRGGTAAVPILPDYRTPGQATFFRYATNAFAEGEHWRLYPQAYYYYNNIGVLAEYAISSEDVRLGAARTNFKHSAWQIAGSYVLTGEDVTFRGSVKPDQNFTPTGNGWGAFELVARVGETDVDNDVFPVFSSLTTSASRARSYGTGLNWYMNENVKLLFDYDFTSFDGGAAAGTDRRDEHLIISRAQFRF